MHHFIYMLPVVVVVSEYVIHHRMGTQKHITIKMAMKWVELRTIVCLFVCVHCTVWAHQCRNYKRICWHPFVNGFFLLNSFCCCCSYFVRAHCHKISIKNTHIHIIYITRNRDRQRHTLNFYDFAVQTSAIWFTHKKLNKYAVAI